MVIDLIIVSLLFFLGRTQFKYRAVKVAGVSALVSTVALVPAFIAAAILFVTIFKLAAVLIALAIMAIAKWKVFVTMKLGYLLAGLGGGLLGLFSGPIGWIALAIIVFVALAYMVEFVKSAFTTVYTWVLVRSAAVLHWVRTLSDRAAEGPLGKLGALFVFPIELAAVAALPVWGLMELWDALAPPVKMFDIDRGLARMAMIIAFVILLYMDYRRATGQGRPVYPDLPDVLDLDGPA